MRRPSNLGTAAAVPAYFGANILLLWHKQNNFPSDTPFIIMDPNGNISIIIIIGQVWNGVMPNITIKCIWAGGYLVGSFPLPHEHNYSSSFLYFSHPAAQINDMGDTAALLLCGKRVHKESPNCQGCGKYGAMYSTSVNTYTSDIFHFISTQRFMDPRKDPNSCLA